MDTDSLEQLLDGGEETDSVEFKAAMDWNRNSLVKDILAMANVQDGGTIIIGVEDATFARQGLTGEQSATYQIETMRDQVAPFADPEVIFSCEIVSDNEGRNYAVIQVAPFEQTPVICSRDGDDVHAGTIYFRSRRRRPESARVATSADMQRIVETAVARRMRAMQRLGFTVEQEEQYDYQGELGDL